MNYLEKIAIFGNQKNLIGVVSLPGDAARPNSSIAVILLNAGLVHRVGPNRMNVDLSRDFAEKGFVSLRFDLSGIGDSTSSAGGVAENERNVTDISEAMTYLSATYGINQFVLIGLCTGADNAHRAAVKDPRVAGAVFLDGYRFPTWNYYLRRYGPVFLNPVRLLSSVYRRFVLRFSGTEGEETKQEDSVFGWKLPPKEVVAGELQLLVDRSVHLFYIFSGEVLECFNTDEFRKTFKSIHFGKYLQVKHFPDSSHTYSFPEDMRRLRTSLSDWLQKSFPT